MGRGCGRHGFALPLTPKLGQNGWEASQIKSKTNCSVDPWLHMLYLKKIYRDANFPLLHSMPHIYAHIAHEFGDTVAHGPGILKVEKFTEITPGNFLVSWVLPLGYPEKFLGFLGYPEKFLGFLGYPGKFLGFLGFPWVIPGIFLVSWVDPLKIILFF